jgi:PPK2 family polyphosphate:nucleotide phosphotransferase
MDTAGKDGTIRAVFEGVNPQGVRVANFKVPSPNELAHDYLWRVHAQTPARGELVIFNRSHYEDVLVVRVHELVPQEVWKKRYGQIVEFERMLVEEGTTILKFYLHIDQEEQKKRLIERIDDPTKQWKFNPGDLDERKLWVQYMDAYEEMLEKTSTKSAPWYAIPSNANWYRDLVVARVIVDTLKGFKMEYPHPAENLAQYKNALLTENNPPSLPADGA